ncbi:hypothetical protein OG948_06735 [Embleya sp. NBC_00888]|uniref:hypothetical protein n=1 Tax=Embleya sp. NBC_00888 TaxID=2975960 RepID=UPI003864C2BA|nr:hypothetical protein OG948_06735 [Embleya sp. NBC_00888]
MSRPEGWEWLDEPREEWDIPDSLRGPAKLVQSNLAAAILSCDFLDHDILALVGRFITEHSLFYLRPLAKGLSFHEQALISDVLVKHTRRTFEAWERFRQSAEQGGPAGEMRSLMQANRLALSNELNNAISAFQQLPGSVA